MHIPPSIEAVASSTHAWRQLSRPSFWTDGGFERIDEDAYVPTLALPEWDEAGERAAYLARRSNKFWLIGDHTDVLIHPADAVDFLEAWKQRTDTVVGFPGATISEGGIKWLDQYVSHGGQVPDAWHVHIVAPWPQWIEQYKVFLNWMRRRLVLRPVVVTGVEAGANDGETQKALVRQLVPALLNTNYLSAVFWSTAYLPQRWGASPLTYSIVPSGLGRAWMAAQREWSDAVTANSPRPTWDLLGEGNRIDNGRLPCRRADGQRDGRAAAKRNNRRKV